jgi:hypothetical protein
LRRIGRLRGQGFAAEIDAVDAEQAIDEGGAAGGLGASIGL